MGMVACYEGLLKEKLNVQNHDDKPCAYLHSHFLADTMHAMYENLQNQTPKDHFIIVGLSSDPNLKAPSFLLVLLIYVLTFSGNLTILLLVCLDYHLHTPMYFFLANLSIVDMSSTFITLHRTLVNFLIGDNTIHFVACMIQMYIFAGLTCSELLILMVMSYDRQMAVCNSLRYHAVMNHRVCLTLVIMCWLIGFIQVLPIVVVLSSITCYWSNVVNHFFCDPLSLKKLLCGYTYYLELSIYINGVFDATCPFLLTFLPYVFIIATILRIRSSIARRKAFYTCSSHLTVVILLYTTLVFQYLRPHSTINLNSNKLFSLFNTAGVPMLNPVIYSLKNKDVKAALKRRLK
ncbi:olfactory receptor 8D1-like [Dendropsophus ebraccatus]|uniref:olfactory receptor 8D1-like n=1 Tax=Dendropsophus ebraccatus TaxID=150705 RepID=UPI00383171F5